MNAPFSAVFRTLNGTAASLSALHETLRRMEAETRTALRLNDQNRERRVCAVQDATDELLEDFAHEYDTLKGDAESLLSAAEIAMNDILDPHFHRMQPQYFSAAIAAAVASKVTTRHRSPLPSKTGKPVSTSFLPFLSCWTWVVGLPVRTISGFRMQSNVPS